MSEIIKTGLVERIEQLIAEAKKRTISAVNTAMIGHLQDFIMELGRGFAFVKRQQLIRTDAQDHIVYPLLV